jgi:hypothetical protein
VFNALVGVISQHTTMLDRQDICYGFDVVENRSCLPYQEALVVISQQDHSIDLSPLVCLLPRCGVGIIELSLI